MDQVYSWYRGNRYIITETSDNFLQIFTKRFQNKKIICIFTFIFIKNPLKTFLMSTIFTTFIIVSLTTFYLLALLSIKIVPQATEWMLERFGRFYSILEPGLHIIIPFMDRVGPKISLREQVLDIPAQDVISKDNAMVRIDGVVFYKIFDSKKASYAIDHLNLAITQLSLTKIRAIIGGINLDNTLSDRESINQKLLISMNEDTKPWGINVLRVEIKDIKPPLDLQEAMSRQMKAERVKRALILEAEGIKKSEILKASGRKESAILKAQGEQESIIMLAKANKERAYLQADAREREAKAESVAITRVGTVISQQGNHAPDFFLEQQRIRSLRDMAAANNSKTIFMPLESSSLISSVGGLLELAKSNKIKKKLTSLKKIKNENIK